ncbi:hypothetical protein BGZ60DRAFT_373083 [Tricladium varicosporioides]|nr:hypothetical protein BGZ60DRAFT_373083 [Hymenoscyphus varicosporioides]
MTIPKALPIGISEHDRIILTKVKRRAHLLDSSWNFCGLRIGYSSVIALIPFLGDGLDAFMALTIIRACQQVDGGLPKEVTAKMIFHLMIDFAIGLVPFIGDVADMVFRANTKNTALLEKYLRKKGNNTLKAQC